MAEFLEWKRQKNKAYPAPETSDSDGFNAMGRPIPYYRQQAAYETCKAMGMTDRNEMTACVGAMSEALERDEPYAAMEAGMKYVDLTGTYRLMAVLLTAQRTEKGT